MALPHSVIRLLRGYIGQNLRMIATYFLSGTFAIPQVLLKIAKKSKQICSEPSVVLHLVLHVSWKHFLPENGPA
jgi:hypothetical protein